MEFKRYTRDDLERLITSMGGPCLSLFLPAPESMRESDKVLIQIGNLCREAQEILIEYWMNESDAESFLRPLISLSENPSFFAALPHGIAVFLSSDSIEVYRVETPVTRQIVIARGFHLRPMLPDVEQLCDRDFRG